ncbi:MAG: zinc ribbon domain-containing protein [bacterium]
MEKFIGDLPNLFNNFDLGKFFMSIQLILLLIYIIISAFLVFKTYADARKRFSDKLLVIIISFFVFISNVFGYAVYSIFRPKENIQDQHLNNLEKFFLEYETRGVGKCKVCRHLYFPEHTYCINCGSVVRTKCNSCGNIVELDWNICPYCGDKKKIDIEKKKTSKTSESKKS